MSTTTKINLILLVLYTFLVLVYILSITAFPGLLGLSFEGALNESQVATLTIVGSITSLLFLANLILGFVNSISGFRTKDQQKTVVGILSILVTIGPIVYVVLYGPWGILTY